MQVLANGTVAGNADYNNAWLTYHTLTGGTNSTNTYRLTMDTTNPLAWVAKFYVVNESAITPFWTYTFGGSDTDGVMNPPLDSIAISNSHEVGTVQNLSLSVNATPEPSTVVLLGTGALGLLAYAWRKRRQLLADVISGGKLVPSAPAGFS